MSFLAVCSLSALTLGSHSPRCLDKIVRQKKEKWSWGRDQTKVAPHSPAITMTPDFSELGFLPPLPPYAAGFSYFSPIACLGSWVCQPPHPSREVSGSGRARGAWGVV